MHRPPLFRHLQFQALLHLPAQLLAAHQQSHQYLKEIRLAEMTGSVTMEITAMVSDPTEITAMVSDPMAIITATNYRKSS
jgi:hypothetical protein